MKKNIKNYKIFKYYKLGFTLVELMVVVAIVAVISVLTLFNNAKLNSSMLLADTAYEISLIIRDAQISGIGSKVTSFDGTSATTSNQGVFIDAYTPEKIIFFADKNKDNQYNIGEENQIYNIENKRAGKILSVCRIVGNDNSTNPCFINNTSNLMSLNILFKRPNPESYFYYNDGSNTNPIPSHPGSVVINIGFPNGGECKSIIVYKTGAIQIDNSFCPK